MKKFFQDAEVKLIRLSATDILTTSFTGDGGTGNETIITGDDPEI